MSTLDLMVRQGKALYVGISSYQPEEASRAIQILQQLGTPCLIHQPKYNMFDRWVEDGLLDVLGKNGVGCIPFSPLAQGMLTSKYLKGIPAGSRAASHRGNGAIDEDQVSEEKVGKVRQLNALAEARGQNLAQMALSWILKDQRITSVLIGASKPGQVLDSIRCLDNLAFSREELEKIEQILK
jgi:L-glyceraldehyde 3-phosphate reductase